MIKESLGIEGDLDEKTAKQIIQSLDDDIQKAKEEQEQKEREAQAIKINKLKVKRKLAQDAPVKLGDILE